MFLSKVYYYSGIASTGKAKKPAAVDPPEKEQAVIMTETNVAYERKPELIKGID